MRALPALTLAVATLCSSCFVTTEQRAPGITVDAAVASKYVFRGVTMVDAEVLQTRFGATLPTTREDGFLVLEAWSNTNLTGDTGGERPGPYDPEAWFPRGDSGEITEWRQTIAYQEPIGQNADLAVGLTTYNWPADVWPDTFTQEVWGRVDWNIGGFVPSVAVHFDVDAVEGFYGQLGLSRAFELNEKTNARAAVTVGYTDGDHAEWFYREDASGLADLHAVLGVDHAPNASTTLFIEGHFSDILEDDLVDRGLQYQGWDIDESPVWAMLGARWSF